MPRIGRRDQLIFLERATTVQNGTGEEVPAWAPLGKEWAAIYWGRGDERRQAAMEQGSQAATFQMLANVLTRSATITDRIVFQGNWDITSIAPDTPARGHIEITAVRST